jgi:hypothetical protein
VRGTELLTANVAALLVGLVLFFLFRPPHVLPVAATLLTGVLAVQVLQSRRPAADAARRGPVFRAASLLLNGLFGSFFAVLAYYLVLAFARQIGYPYD